MKKHYCTITYKSNVTGQVFTRNGEAFSKQGAYSDAAWGMDEPISEGLITIIGVNYSKDDGPEEDE